jgi:alkanesulfonate monooxygenase SsuD/methylene tetrahydromethanopterin reductase-like flavin-dependent oxidoreductase (luciferase family)
VVSGLTFGIYPAPLMAPFENLVERAHRAEAMGFDSLWVSDQTPMAYPDVIELEAWSLLGALARETSRVRLGTLVSPVTLRHPLLLAMCVSTVDHASNGRVVLGMGVGGAEVDLAGVGLEAVRPRELVERLEEQLVMLDALLRGEHVTAKRDPIAPATPTSSGRSRSPALRSS